jgi:hypothetical protein
MKTIANGLEINVQLSSEELEVLRISIIEGKIIPQNIRFCLKCEEGQRELLELNGKPYWDDRAGGINATINRAYYRRIKENGEFEVRYHSGARKFKISITD